MDLVNIMDVEPLESLEPLVVEEQWWDLYDFTESNMEMPDMMTDTTED